MRECRMSGSVRGVPGNGHPYRNHADPAELRRGFVYGLLFCHLVRHIARNGGPARISSANLSIAVTLRARRATRWPLRAKSRAVAPPMPRLAPVIKTGVGCSAIEFPSAGSG
jgi:hypothetical protein